ncbi:MAG: hypothetical protein WC934_04935 [Acidithiobacillus sp.]|jgi:hypothetical protein|uniref:hypothetical protein n=1 Tax=Acidithiobacillus sp. TaxID=1872118 RepID=UPI003560BE49
MVNENYKIKIKQLFNGRKFKLNEIKNECDQKLQNVIKEAHSMIFDSLKKQKQQVLDFSFSSNALELMNNFADKHEAESFTILNPLSNVKGLPYKKKFTRGDFAGGQFNVIKENGQWKIYTNYKDSFKGDNDNWSETKCNELELNDEFFNIGKFKNEVNKCMNAYSDDLKVLEFTDSLAKKNPDHFRKLLEY